MSDAQIILKMIESCDPNDAAVLDEIDALVELYVTGLDIWRDSSGRRVCVIDDRVNYVAEPFQYTRSRDALKAIRPTGWYPDIVIFPDYARADISRLCEGKTYQTLSTPDKIPTEELAELHAIIQAIEFERNKG